MEESTNNADYKHPDYAKGFEHGKKGKHPLEYGSDQYNIGYKDGCDARKTQQEDLPFWKWGR